MSVSCADLSIWVLYVSFYSDFVRTKFVHTNFILTVRFSYSWADEFRMKPKLKYLLRPFFGLNQPDEFRPLAISSYKTTVWQIFSKGVTIHDILTVLLKGVCVLPSPLIMGYASDTPSIRYYFGCPFFGHTYIWLGELPTHISPYTLYIGT